MINWKENPYIYMGTMMIAVFAAGWATYQTVLGAGGVNPAQLNNKIASLETELAAEKQTRIGELNVLRTELESSATRGALRPVTQLPKSIVAAFEGSCPPGWTEHDASKGKFLLGTINGGDISDHGGSDKHTLTTAELPNYQLGGKANDDSHEHRVRASFSVHDGAAQSDKAKAGKVNEGRYTIDDPAITLTTATHSHSVTVDSGGAGRAHNNMPPYFVIRWCKPRPDE